jgi:amino acid permease
MTGKTAAGLVLIVVGVVLALWGVNYMNSFGSQLGRAIGMQDNTGPVAIGAGIVFGIIGLVLVVSKSSSSAGMPQG